MHILIWTWQSEKHKNNTPNTYINTKKHFTHIHLLYEYTQTPAHSLTPSQAQERARTSTLWHIPHTHTQKYTRPADEKVAAAAGFPVSPMLCTPPPPPPPPTPPPPLHQPMPTVTISETQVKALRKRCVLRLDLKDVRDGDNRVCIGTEFHTQGAWYWKVLFKLTRGTQSSLSEDDRSDRGGGGGGGGVRGETVWEVRGQCTIKVAESQCR